MNENVHALAGVGETSEYARRLRRVEDAVALREPDRVPVTPCFGSLPQRLFGSSYRDLYYDFPRAGDAALQFYAHYAPDAHNFTGFISGRANELAGSTMIDWPGRPGTRVSDNSSHQVLEFEYMTACEYPELLRDFTGFMMQKYIPRAFPGLKGLAGTRFLPSSILNTELFRHAYEPATLGAFETLAEIGRCDTEAAAATAVYKKKLEELGFPPLTTASSQAPFDILGNYFRGTMGTLMDQLEREEEIAAACDMFAEQQIKALQFLREPAPIKRVFFPLHKGMDGFMSPKQYERLYWRPLQRVVLALIDMGATPILYTEGKYNTRLEQLTELPRGKVIVHLENTDVVRAKKILGDTACLSGNLPIYLLEFGTREQIVDYCKHLLDICAPGGGYLFDTDGSVENAKPENLDAMFDTVLTYGKY